MLPEVDLRMMRWDKIRSAVKKNDDAKTIGGLKKKGMTFKYNVKNKS
jgi:hypothetical protein